MVATNSQRRCTWPAIIAKIMSILAAGILFAVVPVYAGVSVCDLFAHLKSADGHQLVVSGNLIISKNVAVLGAADCDNRYRATWEASATFPTDGR